MIVYERGLRLRWRLVRHAVGKHSVNGTGRCVHAVVESTEHDGPIDVAFHKPDRDFGADARRVDRAPVRASGWLRRAHPGA